MRNDQILQVFIRIYTGNLSLLVQNLMHSRVHLNVNDCSTEPMDLRFTCTEVFGGLSQMLESCTMCCIYQAKALKLT